MVTAAPTSETFWRPSRDWDGETCVVLGNGPSARRAADGLARFKRLGVRVLAINETYLLAPDADILYFCDEAFYARHRDRDQFRSHPARKVTLSWRAKSQDPALLLLESASPDTPIEDLPPLFDDGRISRGNNSGLQALQLACLLGVRLCLLIGFDMRIIEGETHWTSEALGAADSDRWRRSNGHAGRNPERYEKKFAPLFAPLAQALKGRGMSVVNLTEFDEDGRPLSALTCFPTARV